MRIKLDSLENPKCETWPLGAVIPPRFGVLRLSPSYSAESVRSARPSTSPPAVAASRVRLPPDPLIRALTRSATTITQAAAVPTQSTASASNTPPAQRKTWTPADDALLSRLRREFPKANFDWLGAKLGGRSSGSVQARWGRISGSTKTSTRASSAATNGVGPSRSTRRRSKGTTPSNIDITNLPPLPATTATTSPTWSDEETEKLQALCATLGTASWPAIADQMPGRSADACARKWRRVGPSTTQTPRRLSASNTPIAPLAPSLQPTEGQSPSIAALEASSSKKNSNVASADGSSLAAIARSDWTQHEDAILIEMVEVREPAADWAEVSEALPGRSDGACRGRHQRIVTARNAQAEVAASTSDASTAPASEQSIAPPETETTFAVPSSTNNALQLTLEPPAEPIERPLSNVDSNQRAFDLPKREIRKPKSLVDTMLTEGDKENAGSGTRKTKKARKAQPARELPTVLETASVLFGIVKR